MLKHLVAPAMVFAILINITDTSFCDNLTSIYFPEQQYVSVRGVNRPLSLYWGSDPARAASALLLVVLRYALGYQNVRLRRGPHHLQDLIKAVGHEETGDYNETILALSMAWQPQPSSGWHADCSMMAGLAGPRLGEFGISNITVNQRLHVHLAKDFLNNSECTNATHWTFFTNQGWLNRCGFIHTASSYQLVPKATVYLIGINNTTFTELQARTDAHHLHLRYEEINRASLFQSLRRSNRSFLFIDYDMWLEVSGHLSDPDVRAVELPPCTPSVSITCKKELDSAIAMRVADLFYIQEFAPLIMQLAHNFDPSHDTLRVILERETIRNNVTEAACEWAATHKSMVEEWKNMHGNYSYQILAYFKNPHKVKLERLFGYLVHKMKKTYKINFGIRQFDIGGKNDDYVKNTTNMFMERSIKQRIIGAIVGGVKDITNVAKTLEGSSLPILLYEPADVDDKSKTVWSATGNSYQQALAVNHFICSMKWTRVAVLSEETATAKGLVKHLTDIGGFALRDHQVKLNLTPQLAINILQKLQTESAYIIFVNTNSKDAVTILSAAEKLKMNGGSYAWIVRDWHPNNTIKFIKHITISFSYRNITDVSNYDGWQKLRDLMNEILWRNHTMWPIQAAAITDAVLTLASGFKNVFSDHPSTRYDTHSKKTMQYLNESLTHKPITGVTQTLKYKGHSLDVAMVFVDEWCGDKRQFMARWRVNATANSVRVLEQRRAFYQGNPPKDGASRCIVYSGDLYSPTCLDAIWATALLIIVLAIPSMMLVFRALQSHLKRQAEEDVRRWRTWRDESSTALSAFLVDRSVVEQRHELGAGRFGCVRLAVLRLPGSVPRAVAAKALRNPQEQGEILREACTLASLDHDHIIRLVGVCIDDKPPLVLMEIAFFGDLRQYLQDRRYLVEGAIYDSETDLNKGNEEATHVSAHALTRLGRQAASALGYLSLRGVIHRDLRASNCLVDANRSLKLADFGMARTTIATNMDGGTEYACRRRGLFPVLWMAPESLEKGVFSTASDVWALGVLVFELVTLGARPYGTMSPLRVMQFVAAGNKPPMPHDATPQTCALAQLCWRRKPEERPTAADIVAYLAERPYALRPALIGEHDHLIDPDSGYSDSPMSELLPR